MSCASFKIWSSVECRVSRFIYTYTCVPVCRYGYHITKNSYFICHNQDTIRQLFEHLRNYDGENTYPKECQGFAVTAVRDLTTGYDSNQPDLKAVSDARYVCYV